MLKKQIQKSLLNLHFWPPWALGPFLLHRACRKPLTCKISWVFMPWASSYEQITSEYFFWEVVFEFFLVCFQYFWKNELFKHVLRPGTYLGTRVLTRRVRWCAVRPQKRLGRPVEHRVFGAISISTWNWGKLTNFNSQYLPCLPLFNPYIYTVSSLWIIKPTKVHLSTIYPISQLPFSPRKIVNLWRYKKSLKKHVLVRNKK